MAESAGRGGRGGRQAESLSPPSSTLQASFPSTWHLVVRLAPSHSGPGVMCGSSRVRPTQCAHCLVRSDVGSPRPDSPVRYPLACGEAHGARLLPCLGALVLAQRDGERQRNPAFRLRTCRRRFYLLFLFSQRNAFIPNGCRRHMWAAAASALKPRLRLPWVPT